MEIAEAQRDVRQLYRGGFFGQLVSGAVWLVAAGTGTVISPTAGMVTLLLGGILIFPVTTLLLRLTGRPTSLPSGHPMNALAIQIAFTVPLGLLVAVAAAGYRADWFFPAAMVIVGAHYLPFVFLYGMPLFGVLAGLLAGGGVTLALWGPGTFSLGGWATGVLLVGFAFLSDRSAREEAS
ncbi:MAG: hypothetical protein EA387_16860 [Nitriliruptor sp.]|nr:MAG: hypothetical protein EA387_16860 [Nitriliruptor sp.]